MTTLRCFFLLCTVLLCIPAAIQALYPEQAGQLDWHLSLLPSPSHIVSVGLKSKGASIYYSTSSSTFAAVASQNGRVLWRNVLPSELTLTHLIAQGNILYTLAAPRAVLHSWNVKDGSLRWDTNQVQTATTSNTQAQQHTHFIANEQQQVITILSQSTLRAIHAETGREVWSADIELSSQQPLEQLVLARLVEINHQAVAVLVFKQSVVIAHISPQGMISKTVQISVSATASNTLVLSSGHVVISSTSSKDTLVVVSIADGKTKSFSANELFTIGKITNKETDINNLKIDSLSEFYPQAFVLRMANNLLVLSFTSQSENSLSSFFPSFTLPSNSVDVILTAAPSKDNEVVISKSFVDNDRLTVQVYSGNSDKAVESLVQNLPFAGHGKLSSSWLQVVSRAKDGAAAYRLTLACSDASFHAIHSTSGIVWSREGGLADIQKVDFADLPLDMSVKLGEDEAEYPSFFFRIVPELTSLALNLKDILIPTKLVNKALEAAGMRNEIIQSNDSPMITNATVPSTQDYFGFRRLMLALSGSNKLFALETEKGRTLWSVLLPQGKKVFKLSVVQHHEAVVVFTPEQGQTEVLHIATNTGRITQKYSMPFEVQHIMDLPLVDHHHVLMSLFVDTALNVHVFPFTNEAAAVFAPHAANTFFHLVHREQGNVVGYVVEKTNEKNAKDFKATVVWRINFPKEHEKIVAVALKGSEAIQSSVRVLGGGDGGYLHKYLNPHLISIATERDGSNANSQRVLPSLKRTTDPSVNIYLIDTVTGTVLEKFVHRGAQAPVHLVQTENVIVYHYWNDDAHQYEVSVVELYENREAEAFSLSSIGSSKVEPFSSFHESAPQALQQTYTFRHAISALAVTQTKRGITMKEIVAVLKGSEQLYSFPKAWLDPRRPVTEPTMLDRAEGLIPYTPELPLDPLRVVSYSQSIPRVRGLTSAPVLLESTSIVCAWGVDIFCTRLTPSQTFDQLNEDFNAPFLILTVSAVAFSIVIFRRLAKERDLQTLWK